MSLSVISIQFIGNTGTSYSCSSDSASAIVCALLGVAEGMGVKSGAVMWAVRIAVAGLAVTPGGATEIMEVLGKEETLRRIAIAQGK